MVKRHIAGTMLGQNGIDLAILTTADWNANYLFILIKQMSVRQMASYQKSSNHFEILNYE